MASPQKEYGYTPIANEVMDQLCRIRIRGEWRQVLDFIIRKTYGWNKTEDQISLSQFITGTGLSKIAVCKAVQGLLAMQIIVKKGNTVTQEGNAVTQKGNVTQLGNAQIPTYCFQKDYEQWRPLPKKVTLPKKVMIVTQKGNDHYPIDRPQKTLTTKDTITKDREHTRADFKPVEPDEHQAAELNAQAEHFWQTFRQLMPLRGGKFVDEEECRSYAVRNSARWPQWLKAVAHYRESREVADGAVYSPMNFLTKKYLNWLEPEQQPLGRASPQTQLAAALASGASSLPGVPPDVEARFKKLGIPWPDLVMRFKSGAIKEQDL